MKNKKFIKYAKKKKKKKKKKEKKLVLIIMMTIKSIIKSEIIAINPENLEEMLIIFTI